MRGEGMRGLLRGRGGGLPPRAGREAPPPVYCPPRPPGPQRPSIPAAGLAHVADHAVAAGGGERLAHLLRLLVARTGDDLALDDLPGRVPLAVAEGEHDEGILVGGVE